MSISHQLGPGMFARPKLPNVPKAGCAKADGLSQLTQGAVLAQGDPGFNSGFARIWLGRWPPPPTSA